MTTGPHISLSAETIFTVAGLPITNSMFTSVVIGLGLITFAYIANKSITNTNKPTGLQNFVEAIFEALYSLLLSVTQNRAKTTFFFPVIATFFFFIVFNNWSGLLPGVGTIGIVETPTSEHAEVLDLVPGMKAAAATKATTQAVLENKTTVTTPSNEDAHADEAKAGKADAHAEETGEESHTKFVPIIRPGTADLNTTFALGIFSVLFTQFIGFRYLKFSYFKKFINFSSPIMFIVGLLEIVSEFAKIISFAFRLFGNIFAGEVLLTVIAFIGGSFLFFAPLPFYGLEIFVGFIQALVFSMLSLVFFNMATISHDEH